jgi:hypothetical protein
MKSINCFINRYFTERNLTLAMLCIGALWIVSQIIVIAVFWGKPQYYDAAYYLHLATKSSANGSWYPFVKNMHDDFIVAPGFINYLILQIKLFGTVNVNAIFNLLMNIGIAAEIFYLGKKFFSPKTAAISVIFWCMLYSI